MIGKDCASHFTRARGARMGRAAIAMVSAFAPFGGRDSIARAGVVRVWSSAVVIEDAVRLGDIAEASAFAADEEERIRDIVICASPSAGGSREVSIEMIRSALAAGGVNMARVTIRGSARVDVSRPAESVVRSVSGSADSIGGASPGPIRTESSKTGRHQSDGAISLREAVQAFFDREFDRYGGKAELTFDRTDEQMLELRGPAYEFNVRRRGGISIGLCSLDVDVVNGGETLQTIPLVVRAAYRRTVVIARRSINQGATIGAADVESAEMTFTRLDLSGIDDPAMAIGQRAKRFISGGAIIEVDMLESAPLVKRGQLVTLVSASGGVRVVTTAKAGGDGKLGETIKVRSADDKHVEFDAVVTGPGEVSIGEDSAAGRRGERLASKEAR